MLKLYFLHGFAGAPSDWDEVMAQLPDYDCIPLSYPFALPQKGILIGYSMGGRIALASPLPKIVISSHPGVQTQQEKAARAAQNKEWIRRLQTDSLAHFFKAWYAQPLFASLRAHPCFPKILQKRLQQNPQTLMDQIEKHPLVPAVLTSSTFFIYGERDQAYQALYSRLKIPAHALAHAGHACHLENPAATAQQIKILISGFYNYSFDV